MENNNPNFLKSTMTYGAILGISLVVYNIILYIVNLSLNKPLSYIGYIIIIGGIYLSIKSFRDLSEQKAITYGRAVGVGVLTAVFSSIIVAFYTYILYTYIDTRLIQKLLDLTTEQYATEGLSEEQIDAAINMSSKFMTPGFISFFVILGSAFMGTIFSLIIAAFLKKEPSIFEPSEKTLQS